MKPCYYLILFEFVEDKMMAEDPAEGSNVPEREFIGGLGDSLASFARTFDVVSDVVPVVGSVIGDVGSACMEVGAACLKAGGRLIQGRKDLAVGDLAGGLASAGLAAMPVIDQANTVMKTLGYKNSLNAALENAVSAKVANIARGLNGDSAPAPPEQPSSAVTKLDSKKVAESALAALQKDSTALQHLKNIPCCEANVKTPPSPLPATAGGVGKRSQIATARK